MAELTNIRIQTLSKAVPTVAALAPAKVNVVGNTLVVEDRLGVQYVLGTLYAENIVVETPPMPQKCGCSTANAQVLATLIKGVDGVTPDMSDYYDKSVIDEKLGKKQDAISDLEEIRSGASKGATALQLSDVDQEITNSNRPVRNTAVLNALSDIEQRKQENIPDIAQIREGASKGATALQSVPSEYVTESELQGKGYATTAQVDAKQDKISDLEAIREGAAKGATALQEHQPLKTINGESIIGEGDITIEGGGGEYESNIEDKTLAMPNAVGGIAKGTKISALEGKTYNEMFDDLLFPTVNPTFTAPSASITFKSYSSTQEVGATGPTASNFTVGYNAGAITLNGTKQANRGGTQDTANSFIYVNGSASNKTLPSKVTLGSTTFKYRAAFAEGPQPKNNKGGDYSTPLAAGTVDSSAITLNGTYPWYASTVGVTTSSPVAKQALVAWNATAGKMYTGDNGFTLEASGTVPQVIKVPNSRTITSMEMYDTGAEKWKAVSMSGTWTSSTETISVNGINVTYTVYTYSGATRGQVKLRIKF